MLKQIMHLFLILINVTLKYKYNKCKFCCSVPHAELSYWQFFWLDTSYLIFGRLYFAASKIFHQFFFEFLWNWSSVLTGYNDK